MIKKIVIAIALASLSFGSANAAINLRQLNQQRLIDAGHRSGKLTNRETARLKAEQRSIAAQEDRMRARHHGHLTARDKNTLHARQRVAKHNIQREKYDGQRGRNHLKI